jgi:flagellar hook-associated protein 3 FlgL
MIVNKSMFPLQTGFGVISKMQDKFANLQMQLGTGMKAQTLADMGRDLPVSLSVRSRLSTISGYNASIDQVSLRLSFYDNALGRMDKIEGEARNAAQQGQYGTNNINMATISAQSRARLDEMVTMLNSDVGGRYLFGGAVTDKAPLPDTNTLLYGAGGRAGYQTIVTERKAADAGLDGLGRIGASIDPLTPNIVAIAEDGIHPFGFKLSTMSTTSGAVTATQPQPGIGTQGDRVSITFAPPPAEQIRPGETITMGFTLPDGTETQITMKAVDAANATGAPGEFIIGEDDDPDVALGQTAQAFQDAFHARLEQVAQSELAAASTFAAAENFFNAAGEPVLRVSGNPATATALRVASPADTVMWYNGQSAAVSAVGTGRLDASSSYDALTSTAQISLAEKAPVSAAHGFRITNAATTVSDGGTSPATAYAAGSPASMSVAFDGTEQPGDTITLTLAEPPPSSKSREITLTAVSGKAGPGQFTIGGSVEQTAANFEKAMLRSVTEAAADAEGNPRQSVSALVEDSGRVNYGMQANESGYLRMMRSFAAMSVETYPEVTNATDPNAADLDPAKHRFDAMARRQQLELSEARNVERGSIEMVAMEIGVAWSTMGAAKERHTNYKAQLDNLLSDVETVSKESVAMEILALQTRLAASYQVTAMVSKLSLVNYL